MKQLVSYKVVCIFFLINLLGPELWETLLYSIHCRQFDCSHCKYWNSSSLLHKIFFRCMLILIFLLTLSNLSGRLAFCYGKWCPLATCLTQAEGIRRWCSWSPMEADWSHQTTVQDQSMASCVNAGIPFRKRGQISEPFLRDWDIACRYAISYYLLCRVSK